MGRNLCRNESTETVEGSDVSYDSVSLKYPSEVSGDGLIKHIHHRK
jgi:hypothetical protein